MLRQILVHMLHLGWTYYFIVGSSYLSMKQFESLPVPINISIYSLDVKWSALLYQGTKSEESS